MQENNEKPVIRHVLDVDSEVNKAPKDAPGGTTAVEMEESHARRKKSYWKKMNEHEESHDILHYIKNGLSVLLFVVTLTSCYLTTSWNKVSAMR